MEHAKDGALRRKGGKRDIGMPKARWASNAALIALLALMVVTGFAGCSNTALLNTVAAKVADAQAQAAGGNQVPITPGSPQLVAGANQIALSWTGVPGATKYKLYYGLSNAFGSATAYSGNPVNGTSTAIQGLTAGTVYYIWLIASNAIGDSAPSVTASSITLPASPASPPTLTGGSGSIQVSWASVPSATAYKLFYNTSNSTTGGTAYASNPVTSGTSATIYGLTAGITYYVWVVANNASGDGAPSQTASAVPSASGAPTLTATGTQIGVSWSAVTNATSYKVYYNTSSTTVGATSYTNNPVYAPGVTITGLTAGKTYYVWFVSTVGAVDSAPSAFAQATLVPSTPTNAPSLTRGAAQLTVDWSSHPISDVTGYKVYYNTSNSTSGASAFTGNPTAASSAVITGLTAGETYYVWLVATNGGGDSGYSPAASATFVPATPAAPSVAVATVTSVSASWNSVYGATGYRLYYGTTNSFAASAQGYSGSGLSTSISSLSAGSTYYFWLIASNAGGDSVTSTAASVNLTSPAPSAPSLGASGTSITVNWSTVAGATSYKVFYSTTNSTSGATEYSGDPVSGTTATISGLTAGTTYYVWLIATNVGGDSGYSAVSSVTLAPPSPSAPSLAVSGTQITASWSPVAGASSYKLYYNTANTTAGATAYSGNPIGGTSAQLSGLAAGSTYYFWLVASNASGDSGYSASTGNAASIAPTTPSAPSLTPSGTQITANWTGVSGASSYKLYYNTSNSTAGATAYAGNPVATTYATITGLTPGAAYWVWVIASNGGGDSGYSGSNAATLIPSAPSLSPSGTQIGVSWSASPGVSGYKLYYNTSNTTSGASSFSGNPVTSGTNATIYGLTAGNGYYVWLATVTGVGDSGYSSPSFATLVPPAPGAPTLSFSGSQISASWSSVNGATGYKLYYSTSNYAPGASAYNGGSAFAGTSATITGLSPGSTYYIWVKGSNAGGDSDYGAVGSITLLPTPAAPIVSFSNLWATVGSVAVGDASNCYIYYNSSNDSSTATAYPYNPIPAGTSSQLTGTPFTAGSTWYFWVKQSDGSGTSGFGPSSFLVFPPAAPTVTAINWNNHVTLSWNAVAGATSYSAYYGSSMQSTTPGSSAFANPYTGTWAASPAIGSNTYNFIVVASNAGGISNYNQTYVNFTVQSWSMATTLTSAAGTHSISARANAITGAPAGTTYYLYYSATNNQATAIAMNNGNPVTAGTYYNTPATLTQYQTYYFWAEAVNSVGETWWSNMNSTMVQ